MCYEIKILKYKNCSFYNNIVNVYFYMYFEITNVYENTTNLICHLPKLVRSPSYKVLQIVKSFT